MGIWNNISNWWNGDSARTINQTIPLTDPKIQFFFNDGKLQWYRGEDAEAVKRVYEVCAPVSSIIDKMADAFVAGDFQALNENTQNKVRGVNKEWQKLIDKPNWYQDGSQFFKQLYTYRKMWGWCYVLKMKATGFTIPTGMLILPPWLLRIEYKTGQQYQAKDARRVTLCFNGEETVLENDDLMLFTDVTNVYDEMSWLPRSRVFTKQYSVSLIISILEAETALIQHKGALGVISSADRIEGMGVPMTEAQKEDLQRQWHNRYGLSRDKAQMIFANSAVSYTPLVFDFNQLQLKETYLNCIKDVCDGLNYPIELSAHSDRSTYNNVLMAETSLYQNAIMPDSKSIFKSLDNQLGATGVTLWADYTGIEALQRGKKDKAEARKELNAAKQIEWNNGLITRNDWLEALEEETRPSDPLFNKTKFELTPEEMGIIVQPNSNALKN